MYFFVSWSFQIIIMSAILKGFFFSNSIYGRYLPNFVPKGSFYSESAMHFSNLQNKYSRSLYWAWNLNKLFTIFGGKFKFQGPDSDLECFFGDLTNTSHFLEKPPLVSIVTIVEHSEEQSTKCKFMLQITIYSSAFLIWANKKKLTYLQNLAKLNLETFFINYLY